MGKKLVLLVLALLLLASTPVAFAGGGHGHGSTKVSQWQSQGLCQFQFGTGLNGQGYKTSATQFYVVASRGAFATGSTVASTAGLQVTLGGGQVQGMHYSVSQGAAYK